MGGWKTFYSTVQLSPDYSLLQRKNKKQVLFPHKRIGIILLSYSPYIPLFYSPLEYLYSTLVIPMESNHQKISPLLLPASCQSTTLSGLSGTSRTDRCHPECHIWQPFLRTESLTELLGNRPTHQIFIFLPGLTTPPFSIRMRTGNTLKCMARVPDSCP